MSKLPNVGTTIFTTMSKLANQYNAINLSQGFPNFPIDEKLTNILCKTAFENAHQYAPMAGNIDLLESLSELIYRQYRRKINPSENILVTAGATQAIFTTIQALVYTNDEVVILDPAYDCYEPAIQLCNAIPIRLNLNNDYTPNWDRIFEVVSNRTKMIIINNPHNPSGKTFSDSDIHKLEELLLKYPKLILLSDEVYEFITYEKKHISANSSEILRERCVIASSFGKTFHITGWKVGYLVAPNHLMNEIKKVHQYLVFSVNSVAQITLANYLKETDVNDLGGFYQQKRDYFQSLISKSRFEILPCEGSYFQLLSYKNITTESDVNFVQRLVKENGIAAIPLSVFYKDQMDNQVLRFCFAKNNETLLKAAEILCKI